MPVLMNSVVCLGDSLVAGYNAKGFPDFMHAINAGIPGDTTGGMLARFSHYQGQVLVLQGGINDLYLHSSIDHIICNIHAINRQAKFRGFRVILLIPPSTQLDQLSVEKSFFTNSDDMYSKIKDLRLRMIDYTKEDCLEMIDLDTLSLSYLEDGLHFTEKCHEEIAKKIQTIL